MLPIVASLMQAGITTLGGAILEKGKQYVEEKLGIDLPDEDKPLTDDQLESLRRLEFEHEEKLMAMRIESARISLEEQKSAQTAVTERWKADMLSDSWLSKNIRPMTLIYLLVSYTVMSLLSAAGINVTQAYVELLGQMLMLVMSAYFVARTVEKLSDIKERGK